MNTVANLKKLGLEFKQAAEQLKTKKNYKEFITEINNDSDKADLLENFDKVLDNMWKGTTYKILIGMYYILKRHNNVCFFSGKIDTPKKRLEFNKYKIMYSTMYKNSFDIHSKRGWYDNVKILDNSIKEYTVTTKKGYGRKKIVHKNKIIEFMNVPKDFDLKEQIENCKKNNKRFFIGLIYLLNDIEQQAHSNSFIYDIEKQELEIFEPNGGKTRYIHTLFDTDEFFKLFSNYFLSNGIPVSKYYKPIEYCPQGPQYFDKDKKNLIKNAPGGYCAAWSIYYLDARLSNPNVPRDLLITFMIEKFRDESIVFINSYSTFILNNFLTNVLNIKKIKKTYPNFINNFARDKLSINEKKYLSNELFEEINLLLRMM